MRAFIVTSTNFSPHSCDLLKRLELPPVCPPQFCPSVGLGPSEWVVTGNAPLRHLHPHPHPRAGPVAPRILPKSRSAGQGRSGRSIQWNVNALPSSITRVANLWEMFLAEENFSSRQIKLTGKFVVPFFFGNEKFMEVTKFPWFYRRFLKQLFVKKWRIFGVLERDFEKGTTVNTRAQANSSSVEVRLQL